MVMTTEPAQSPRSPVPPGYPAAGRRRRILPLRLVGIVAAILCALAGFLTIPFVFTAYGPLMLFGAAAILFFATHFFAPPSDRDDFDPPSPR
jgi:zinc transporter ZupT